MDLLPVSALKPIRCISLDPSMVDTTPHAHSRDVCCLEVYEIRISPKLFIRIPTPKLTLHIHEYSVVKVSGVLMPFMSREPERGCR